MADIDYIMDLLDWNRTEEEQAEGLRLARQVKAFNVFLQPCDKRNNKNVWDNCALIVSEKEDAILEPYLPYLFAWIQDLNWPGAWCCSPSVSKFCTSTAYSGLDSAYRRRAGPISAPSRSRPKIAQKKRDGFLRAF